MDVAGIPPSIGLQSLEPHRVASATRNTLPTGEPMLADQALLGGDTSPVHPVMSPFAPSLRATATPVGLPTVGDMASAASETPARGLSWKSFAVGALAALAVAGAVGAIGGQHAPAATPPATSQAQVTVPAGMTARQAQTALNTLQYLDKVGLQEGGGLYHKTLGLWETKIDAGRALQDLAGGNPVIYRGNQQEAPRAIHDMDDLNALHSDVMGQQARKHIDEGVRSIKKGLDHLGSEVHKAADDFRRGFEDGYNRHR